MTIIRDHVTVTQEIRELQTRIAALELELSSLAASPSSGHDPIPTLSLREYERYGRQMILHEMGLPNQLVLKSSSILVIGAGGLGCPVLLYLAAAGIGEITILDHDQVELSNLHRQVLHTEARIGTSKAESAAITLRQLNSDIRINALAIAFTPALFSRAEAGSTSSSILNPSFSLILDCTDNPSTRYFINSYASAHRIPLVSGGAVRTEGVVGVYGLPLPVNPGSTSEESIGNEIDFGPCYACLFPAPPIPAISLSEEQLALQGTGACSDEGVIGIACGVVGLSMCSEAIRVLLGLAKPTLHLFSPLSSTPVRTIKVRPRKPACVARCSIAPAAWKADIAILESTGAWPGWVNSLCESAGMDEIQSTEGDRISVIDFAKHRQSGELQATIIDLRSEPQFSICHLEGSTNIPFPSLLRDPSLALSCIASNSSPSASASRSLYLVCRRGNDSFLAARTLRRFIASSGSSATTKQHAHNVKVYDVMGGLQAWSREVDSLFPVY